MPRPPSEAQARIVRQINLTLEGQVADVMAQLVPELKKLPRRGVLQCVLDDPDLLDTCFKAFRANPDRFRQLLVDEHDVPVEQADALLACGRSLDDVVAMVVRTCAKRHFRSRLDGDARPLKGGERPSGKSNKGLMGKLMRLLSMSPAKTPAKRSRGEVLYDAMQEHLVHDWQVALVPEYSTLSPALVKRLGKRILDYKVPEDIRRLKENPAELPTPSTLPETIPAFLGPPAAAKAADKPKPAAAISGGQVPAPVHEVKAAGTAAPAANADRRARISEILTPDGKRLRSAAFTMTLLDPAVRAELPNAEQTVRITGLLAEVGGLSAKMLVGELGLRMDQLAVMTLVIYDLMGEEMFKRSFGIPGNLEYVSKYVERAKAAGIGQDTSLGEIGAFVRKTFANAPRAAQ
ncbi:hypothetical protein CCC_03048 [Paramagnetospirillum magnetotacticum MS-1]|uniref:Uncharacterized protein n=1 Tax=Paramagnetospirillum magnetotacticum MS-1 TaxID=272627 RepID=A0A0C2YKF8_PARME|nr:hypothetical protein [Paramagnetospirillum magnetotacticum]KIM00260.1 hypothetical protein CCC_03048 [Paramagnetospirillum magnetotacticum MS-1]